MRQSVALLVLLTALAFAIGASPALGADQDPAEPPSRKPVVRALPRPAGAIRSVDVSEPSLRATIQELVSCGTRNSLSSWTDPRRGIGCAHDKLVARFRRIAAASRGKLEVKVDRYQATSPRTHNLPAPMENVLAILPGNDSALAQTAFVVSGHYDSMPSNVMDATTDAPGADDDASGTAVSVECARLLATRGPYRATIVFAAVSGEEQGLLGSIRLLKYLEDQGYTIGGMLDNDIVGADFAPGAPHRVRVFSGGGPEDDSDSPSRELARAVEEIDGRGAIRLVFRLDRLRRGGDHIPFYEAGFPAVRFTEPLENYHHQHQTPRTENGVEYGDLMKFLNFRFIANVARDNAEVLRELALAPAPPESVKIAGGATPDTRLSWTAGNDPERAGFEILWRETTNPRWSAYEFAASPGETVLKGVSTDNHFFAVRSLGKNSARSIAVTPVVRRPTFSPKR